MAKSDGQAVMAMLGHPPAVARLYERVRAHAGRELETVAEALLTTPGELRIQLAPLLEAGIVRFIGTRLAVEGPVQVVSRHVVATATQAADAHAQLSALAKALPHLVTNSGRPDRDQVGDVVPLEGELTTGGHPVALLTNLVRVTPGDLMWLRPEVFSVERESAMLPLLAEVVASGRGSRSIHTVKALAESPEVLLARLRVGEEVRVLPELPTRLVVMGTSHAVVPEPLGNGDDPRSLVRQRGLVEAMGLWFDELWRRAEPVTDSDNPAARIDLRRFLLEQLATGAQDEQVARRLGLSLRTVRRRVADVLAELGADSRFQAGVEAVRRGWL